MPTHYQHEEVKDEEDVHDYFGYFKGNFLAVELRSVRDSMLTSNWDLRAMSV